LIWLFELSKPELKAWVQGAQASLSPLTSSERNTIQGCNPLKIIESAGFGTPIIASRLPVVSEILTEEMYWPTRPDHVTELARTIETVYSSPQESIQKAAIAKKHVMEHFTWQKSTEKLINLYQKLQG
jgi:glycosyltransferase involved in cell wall biosynthesis